MRTTPPSRLSTRLLIIAAGAVMGTAIAACGFVVSGSAIVDDDAAQSDSASSRPPDDDASGGGREGDGSGRDGGLLLDGGDSNNCVPILSPTPGRLVAPAIGSVGATTTGAVTRISPIKLDAVFDEWKTCFVSVTTSNAGLVRSLVDGGADSIYASFSVVHDADRIYVAARAHGDKALGAHASPEVYRNDSIVIYIDADGAISPSSPSYDTHTLQIVVDHGGRIGMFRNQSALGGSTVGFDRAVTRDGNDFTVEAALGPELFDLADFPPSVRFTFSVNNGDGDNQLGELVWSQRCNKASGCGCGSGDDAPYCDARQFGELVLLP